MNQTAAMTPDLPINWSWTKREVTPQDIFDAVATFDLSHCQVYELEITTQWTASDAYLSWAKESLQRADAFGYDAAVCYAKRAVCQRLDAFMVANHLRHFLSKNYPDKLTILNEIGLCAPTIIHDLVIDPRNDIEHEYQPPDGSAARHAVQLADLFIRATQDEAKQPAIISLGGTIACSCFSINNHGVEKIDFALRPEHAAFLYVDYSTLDEPDVLVIRPSKSEIDWCALKTFSLSEAKTLAMQLRESRTRPHNHQIVWRPHWPARYKADLGF